MRSWKEEYNVEEYGLEVESKICELYIDFDLYAEVIYYSENNYGADADGNRGIYIEEIDDINIIDDTLEIKIRNKWINFNSLKDKNKKRIVSAIENYLAEYNFNN